MRKNAASQILVVFFFSILPQSWAKATVGDLANATTVAFVGSTVSSFVQIAVFSFVFSFFLNEN